MSFIMSHKLPTPKEIIAQYPVPEKVAAHKAMLDQEICDVISGKSDKFLVIIGPCSADNEDSVCDYISRLVPVAEKVKDKVIIIPRIYTNKPRTNGQGYKGMMHQPDPNKAPNLLGGLIAIRKLHMRALEEFGLPVADEMLYGGYFVLCRYRCPFCGRSAAPSCFQRHRRACRHEKPDKRRLFYHAQFGFCRAAQP